LNIWPFDPTFYVSIDIGLAAAVMLSEPNPVPHPNQPFDPRRHAPRQFAFPVWRELMAAGTVKWFNAQQG
jgi:hypothetical protein